MFLSQHVFTTNNAKQLYHVNPHTLVIQCSTVYMLLESTVAQQCATGLTVQYTQLFLNLTIFDTLEVQ